jgi:hypothetical protein
MLKNTVGDRCEMTAQRAGSVQDSVPASLEIGDAGSYGFPQCLDACAFLGVPAFHEAETVAQYLTGVLVAAGIDELLDQTPLDDR